MRHAGGECGESAVPLSEPGALWRHANKLLDALAHASQLRDAVGCGE
jgi:hypothetical protein